MSTKHQPGASPTPPPATDGGLEAWLDGLAGRDGVGPEHAEGATLRDALRSSNETVTSGARGWEGVRRDARARDAAVAGAARNPAVAANDTSWSWRRLRPAAAGLAGALLLAVGVVVWRDQQDAPTSASVMRGVPAVASDGSPAQVDVWHVSDPRAAAEGLAAELRRQGASVNLKPEGDGAFIEIVDPGLNVDEVAATLAAVKLGLARGGHTLIHVRQ